jgi:hypothetical protein
LKKGITIGVGDMGFKATIRGAVVIADTKKQIEVKK